MASRNQRPFWANRMKSYQCKQANINRLIMSYLLREGYKDASRSFQAQAKLESGAKLDSEEYRNAVRAGQLQYAMEMAKKLYKKFDADNYMYFHMQQLQLFEILRQRKKAEAISSTPDAAVNPSPPPEKLTGTPIADIWSLADNSDLDSSILKLEETKSMEPRLVFLIKLILWAQNKLDNEHVCIDHMRQNFEMDSVGDYELELMCALQHSV
ncbi:glucose-induced degradation protein 8-A homolog [Drosophila albomicans]|uniref:Glucose-induced degradation protein 8-A homolog n=1 Tax=Drosophila albomicans TaxID=7291 RepID=A0A6P8Y4P0_DROAB|nr:glucose-induced degradation protein 8-A homolog [Drosophila albomicans]XP_051861473.1 glucose-induced degradation protein 8-A homolog [Drosophila albomicans]XP_051861474.1 glucose-induced degradation protein 8-A homolog [Drosophila albomicans]XP_051861475.1 glucose-induced degradation protein 8-A homolog [Drosophila albomicans]